MEAKWVDMEYGSVLYSDGKAVGTALKIDSKFTWSVNLNPDFVFAINPIIGKAKSLASAKKIIEVICEETNTAIIKTNQTISAWAEEIKQKISMEIEEDEGDYEDDSPD